MMLNAIKKIRMAEDFIGGITDTMTESSKTGIKTSWSQPGKLGRKNAPVERMNSMTLEQNDMIKTLYTASEKFLNLQ